MLFLIRKAAKKAPSLVVRPLRGGGGGGKGRAAKEKEKRSDPGGKFAGICYFTLSDDK